MDSMQRKMKRQRLAASRIFLIRRTRFLSALRPSQGGLGVYFSEFVDTRSLA